MHRFVLVTALAAGLCAPLAAQRTMGFGDVLGPHVVAGRGCAACHAPHSSNTATPERQQQDQGQNAVPGIQALWGEDVTGAWGEVVNLGGESGESTSSARSPDVSGLLSCLSCHDGNLASPAMMKNRVYETLPGPFAKVNPAPTLLGGESRLAGYVSNHPVGLSVKMSCGGDGWDCTTSEGVVSMRGPASSQFVTNYGFFVKPGSYKNQPVVMCTTCHDPHAMSVVQVSRNTRSGLLQGDYVTMFFLRGPYNPATTNASSNQTAQFCRQCHGELSNEKNGSMAMTVF